MVAWPEAVVAEPAEAVAEFALAVAELALAVAELAEFDSEVAAAFFEARASALAFSRLSDPIHLGISSILQGLKEAHRCVRPYRT